MENTLQIGIKGEKQIIVEMKDTASQYGSGLIDVFATPAMIGLMEVTAQLSVQPFLEEGDITLGTDVSVKHLKATAVGKKVVCQTELKEIEGRKLTFDVRAYDESGEIGCGTHERFIVNKEKFLKKLS